MTETLRDIGRPNGAPGLPIGEIDPEGQLQIDPAKFASAVNTVESIAANVEKLLANPEGVKIERAGSDGQIQSVSAAAVVPDRPIDDDAAERVRSFLAGVGPTFISKPYRGWVYVAHTPTAAQNRDATVAAVRQSGGTDLVGQDYLIALFLACSYGRVAESDPVLSVVRAFPSEPKKWQPSLQTLDFMESRDPTIFEKVLSPLVVEYTDWRLAVTPTDAEMEKYSGLSGTATPS